MIGEVIDEERFKMFVDYALKVKRKQIVPNHSKRVKKAIGDTPVKQHTIFTYLVDLMGYNKFPTIVGDRTFDKTTIQVLYRGDKDIKNLAQLIADYDYHYGAGAMCNGIFATTDYNYAKMFAEKTGDIMALGINRDAKVAHYDFLEDIGFALFYQDHPFWFNENCNKLSDYLDELPKKDRKYIAKILLADLSKLAILLGYDAIAIRTDLSEASYIFSILNRNCMMIKEGEYNRIVNSTETYKDGHIVDKPDDDFLME